MSDSYLNADLGDGYKKKLREIAEELCVMLNENVIILKYYKYSNTLHLNLTVLRTSRCRRDMRNAFGDSSLKWAH